MVKRDWSLKDNKSFFNHFNMQSAKIITDLGITISNYLEWTITIPSFNFSWIRNEGLVRIGFKKDKLRMYFYRFFQAIPKIKQDEIKKSELILFESDPNNKLLNIYFLPIDQDITISIESLLEEAENEIKKGNYYVPYKYSMNKIRSKQTVWRKIILRNYNYECCMPSCDINNEELLQTCHIKEYSIEEDKKIGHRANPQNGLCFCYLCHRLFDKGYFSLTYDYKIEINKNIVNNSEIIKNILDNSSGELISNLPKMSKRPSKEYIQEHRKKNKFKLEF